MKISIKKFIDMQAVKAVPPHTFPYNIAGECALAGWKTERRQWKIWGSRHMLSSASSAEEVPEWSPSTGPWMHTVPIREGKRVKTAKKKKKKNL